MIDLHHWPTPNGWKLSIALEELGLPYRVVPVNIARGGQTDPAFVSISPNGRIPALVDHEPVGGGEPLSIFESGAMLIYLADKAGRLIPSAAADPRGRSQVLQWLMWQMAGLGPMLGQHGHFHLYAAEKIPYAIDRYRREAQRLYGVLDAQLRRQAPLASSPAEEVYVAGGAYSIADIAIFPWVMTHKAQGFTLDDWPAVKRWFAQIRAREAVQRGLAVGRELRGPQRLPDAEARRHLFGAGAGADAPNPPPEESPR